ncbi:MAG TPA: hypothetical protein VHU62_06830 [Mycobacterium sp.]|nr:hypothetical protein [Mycobacterium sp.]
MESEVDDYVVGIAGRVADAYLRHAGCASLRLELIECLQPCVQVNDAVFDM